MTFFIANKVLGNFKKKPQNSQKAINFLLKSTFQNSQKIMLFFKYFFENRKRLSKIATVVKFG
jgi:hypothetical protein